MTDSTIRTWVRQIISDCGSHEAAAAALGVSTGLLSFTATGKRPPGPKLLAALGIVRSRTVTHSYTLTKGNSRRPIVASRAFLSAFPKGVE